MGVESTIKASYPAVLKGRTAASPPNPNIVPSGKVPPPVPPRGSGRVRTEELRGTSASTSTSGRGETNNKRAFLHETVSTHHLRTPQDSLHEIIPSFRLPKPTFNTTDDSVHPIKAQWVSNNDPRVSFYDNVHLQQLQKQVCHQHDRRLDLEEDEFVSVEKVDDSYYIRTSPCPFRPERGNYRTCSNSQVISPFNQELKKWIKEEEPTQSKKLQKFTYFMNPSQNPDLMNYKMSRKDKKHSETYYEKIKRKERENMEKGKELLSKRDNFVSGSDYSVNHELSSYPMANASVRNSNFSGQERRRHSLLKHRIFEKRLKKKKLAPIPSIRHFIATSASTSAFPGSKFTAAENTNFKPPGNYDSRTAASERREMGIQFGNRIQGSRPIFHDNNALKFQEKIGNDGFVRHGREFVSDHDLRKFRDILKPTSVGQPGGNLDLEFNDSMRLPNFSFLHGYSNTRIYKF